MVKRKLHGKASKHESIFWIHLELGTFVLYTHYSNLFTLIFTIGIFRVPGVDADYIIPDSLILIQPFTRSWGKIRILAKLCPPRATQKFPTKMHPIRSSRLVRTLANTYLWANYLIEVQCIIMFRYFSFFFLN